MKPSTAPSRSSNQSSEDDLYKFLSNSNFRKKYNKILNLAKKYRVKEAKIDYLKTCIEEQLISSDFNLLRPRHSQPAYDTVREASKSASIELMRIALLENESEATELIKALTDSFNNICLSADSDVREQLKCRLQSKSQSFKLRAEKFTEIKLNKLRNKDPSPSVFSPENIVKKKKRKWIKKSKYKRIKKSLLRQRISVVFNYSSITLTPSMEKVLNRGLNFAIMPLKLNLTQVLVDYKRFE